MCDTGVLVAALIRNQPRNFECSELLTGCHLARRPLLLPATVAAEVGYFLERYGTPQVEAAFLASVGDGDLQPVDLVPADYTRMAELVEHYDDLPLGTTDASVVALAERLNVVDIATLDRRHFSVVRPCHAEHFVLLPE